MRDDGAKLDGRREGALSALLSEPSIRDAAKKARLSEATVYRYLAEPDFAARYREARREAIGHLTTRLQAKADASAAVLSEIAEDEGPCPLCGAAGHALAEVADTPTPEPVMDVHIWGCSRRRGSRRAAVPGMFRRGCVRPCDAPASCCI